MRALVILNCLDDPRFPIEKVQKIEKLKNLYHLVFTVNSHPILAWNRDCSRNKTILIDNSDYKGDIFSVLSDLGISEVDIVGSCTGSEIYNLALALKAVELEKDKVTKVTIWINLTEGSTEPEMAACFKRNVSIRMYYDA
jgi:hypothetical protein